MIWNDVKYHVASDDDEKSQNTCRICAWNKQKTKKLCNQLIHETKTNLKNLLKKEKERKLSDLRWIFCD